MLFSLSCKKDFLEVQSQSQLSLDTYFTSYAECRAATAPLYNKVWYQFSSQFYFNFGDGRANNLFTPYSSSSSYGRLSETIETPDLNEAWQSIYSVITQSDYVINNLDKALEYQVPASSVNACKGEARFMRGLAYWYATSAWGNVPIVEDPVATSKLSQVPPNRQEDVLQYAIRDLEYAVQWLPLTDDKGRVTRYSALGVLSRLYITAACYARGNKFSAKWPKSADEYYALAKAAAKTVVEAPNYSLMTDYEQLFRVQNNNNSESLFALQFVPGSAVYGTGNRNQDWLAYSTALTDGLTAYGGSLFVSGELVKLMHDRGEVKRKKATFFYPGATYDYIGTHTTAGRWVVETSTPAYPTIKKHVVGSNKDSGGSAINGNTGLAAPMLRLAEVYLIYAESILARQSSTNDAEALKYFNAVRTRAGIAPLTSINMADIWDERRCELALEGQFWYDMVRRAYWDENWVLNYMNNQNRSRYYYYLKSTAPNGFIWRDQYDGQIVNPATADRLVIPYPATELVLNPKLRDTPVPFDFK